MPIRLTYFLGFLVIIALLLVSIYLQTIEGIIPCPLCSLQRLVFILLGFLFLFGLFLATKRWGRYFINFSLGSAALIGILLAGRQIWLQRFATGDNSECGVSLSYMLQVFPLHEVMQKIILGSAECTQRGWEFWSLNMAEWALVWFALFFILAIYLLIKESN